MKLVCSGSVESAKRAAKFDWSKAIASPWFVVLRDNDDPIANVEWGNGNHCMTLGEKRRIIPRNEVIPTVRLYVDVQKRRGTLDFADLMHIQPV